MTEDFKPAEWKTDGMVREQTLNGYPTSGVAVSETNSARAIALVYAGFGDGPDVARLVAASPKLLAALSELLPIVEAYLAGSSRKRDLAKLRAAHMAIAEARGRAS